MAGGGGGCLDRMDSVVVVLINIIDIPILMPYTLME